MPGSQTGPSARQEPYAILFVLSSAGPVSSAELALLIAMIAVFVAALLLVSRYDPAEADGGG